MRKLLMYRRLFVMGFFAAILASSTIAYADNSSETKNEIKTLKASIKKLKRLTRNSAARRALANASANGLLDSDGDGLPDIFENIIGTSSCDDDSDDDGLSDDDEGESGSKPDDSTSGEVELKGTIVAITNTTVTVGNHTFTAVSSTLYEKGATSLSSFSIGDFVELKGKLNGGTLELIKIKFED